MQHLLSSLPEHVRVQLEQMTPTDAWGVLIEFAIREKEKAMAELSISHAPEELYRKFVVLKAERQQLDDLFALVKSLHDNKE